MTHAEIDFHIDRTIAKNAHLFDPSETCEFAWYKWYVRQKLEAFELAKKNPFSVPVGIRL